MPRFLHILPLLLLPFALAAQDTLTISTGHVTTGEAATAITTITTGMPDVVITNYNLRSNILLEIRILKPYQ